MHVASLGNIVDAKLDRPEIDILTKLRNLDGKNLTTTGTLAELDIQSQKDRVGKYIKHKLSDLKGFKFSHTYTDDILAMVLHEVSERAGDNLL